MADKPVEGVLIIHVKVNQCSHFLSSIFLKCDILKALFAYKEIITYDSIIYSDYTNMDITGA